MSLRSWNDKQIKDAVSVSINFTQLMQKLNLCDGINRENIKEYIIKNRIDISHFETPEEQKKRLGNRRGAIIPIEEILVKGSTYSRTSLKNRLYRLGLKKRVCEICGQGETWRDKKMSLILDHSNGDRTDNRIENLRIVCPNCNATFETHAGRNRKRTRNIRVCICGREILDDKTYCSNDCYEKQIHRPRISKRKVMRPAYNVLLAECNRFGFSAVGRKYGVRDNSVRKWIKHYERCLKETSTAS